MADDDLSNGVGVGETGVEDEGDEVGMEDGGVQEEVDGDEGPGEGEGEEAEQGDGGGLGAEGACGEDVEDADEVLVIREGDGGRWTDLKEVDWHVPGICAEKEDKTAIDHIPIRPRQIIKCGAKS